MSPDKRGKPPKKARSKPAAAARTQPSSNDVHDIKYFQRHVKDDPTQAIPGREYLHAQVPKVRNLMRSVLAEVAASPPNRFSGGGYWEAMHGSMGDWYEVRVDGPQKKTHHRLFCRLDYDAKNFTKPLLVIICGMTKPVGHVFSAAEYQLVRDLGAEYLARANRSVA